MGELLACDCAVTFNQPCGWFAPTYKFLDEVWYKFEEIFAGAPHVTMRKSERAIHFHGGGSIEFWTLDRPHAGRGRKYGRVIVDEGAIVRGLGRHWDNAIRPTLTDLRGCAWFLSSPFGHNDFHRLWTLGASEPDTWAAWQMPTASNPFIDPAEIEAARQQMPADAFAQEYLAQFLADAANPFGLDAIAACVEPMEAGVVDVWGIDLAKSVDWTVAVGLDDAGHVCAFQRWQASWRNTTERLRSMIRRAPALIDSTGVGDPIVEELCRASPMAEGYRFSSQSKQQLMEGLAVAIQRGEVRFPDGVLRNELDVFQFHYHPGGRVQYEAPPGMHDDCVMALALAVECRRRRAGGVRISTGRTRDEEAESAEWDDAGWIEQR